MPRTLHRHRVCARHRLQTREGLRRRGRVRHEVPEGSVRMPGSVLRTVLRFMRSLRLPEEALSLPTGLRFLL